MSVFLYENNINTSLANAISASATSLTLSSAANLPASIPAGQFLAITLNDVATKQNFEVVYATAITGATLTVLRAQEGSAALSWLTGDFAYSAPTKGQMSSLANVNGSSSQPFAASNLTAATGVFSNIQDYPTPGTYTFTVPAGVYAVEAIVTAGGASGNGCDASTNTQTFSGAGGGAGGTAIGVYSVTPGEAITIIVGAGGAAFSGPGNGNAGDASSFGSFSSANGGQGGQYINASTQAGGFGGAAVGGQVNVSGGDGNDGQIGTFLLSGSGGASFWGGGGRAGALAGQSGQAPGSGGGGAYDTSLSGHIYPSGAGGPGLVVVRW